MVDPVTMRLAARDVRLAVLDAYHQTRGTRSGLMKIRRLIIERLGWKRDADQWYVHWHIIAPYLDYLIRSTK